MRLEGLIRFATFVHCLKERFDAICYAETLPVYQAPGYGDYPLPGYPDYNVPDYP